MEKVTQPEAYRILQSFIKIKNIPKEWEKSDIILCL